MANFNAVTAIALLIAGISCFSLAQDNFRITPSFTRNGEIKSRITIHAVRNYGGLTLPIGAFCTEGLQIAVDAATKRLQLGSRYQIEIDLHDDKCDHPTGIAATLKVLESSENNTVPVLIGPGCGENVYTGMFMQHYNFVAVAEGSIIADMYVNRGKYNSFFVLEPSIETYYEAIPAFLEKNGWSRVFLLTASNSYWGFHEKTLHYNLAKRNITLGGVSTVVVPPKGLPTPEHFQSVVEDLASKNPRIVIVNTVYGAILPCYLYRNKLYGPEFVYIFYGPSLFLPNTASRAEGCTDEMLLEMLQSIILFMNAAPINANDQAVDTLGTRKNDYEETLTQRMNQPQLEEKWFYWRAVCYNEAVAALLVLDDVDAYLQGVNDSLLNWVTQSDNFRQNGNYIHSLLKEHFGHLKFGGLTTDETQPPNSRQGVTAFFQMQLLVSDSDAAKIKGKNLSAIIKPVTVGTYDAAKPSAGMLSGPGKLVWKTPGGRTPFDSLRTFFVRGPILGKTANSVLTAFACLLLATNVGFLAVTCYKRNSANIVNSLPWINTILIIGNCLMTMLVLVLPVEGSEMSHANCMAASLLVTAGLSLVVSSMLSKMEIAFMIVRAIQKNLSAQGRLRMGTVNKNSNRKNSNKNTNNRPNSLTPYRNSINVRIQLSEPSGDQPSTAQQIPEQELIDTNILLKRYAKRGIFFPLFWMSTQLAVMAIWFGLEPIETDRYLRQLEFSKTDPSVAYQHYTISCIVQRGAISDGFIAALIVCYGLLVLRSFYMAFTLRHVKVDKINDLPLIITASYMIAVQVVASAAVVWALYGGSDPGTLQIAASSVALIAVGLGTAIVFIPKIK